MLYVLIAIACFSACIGFMLGLLANIWGAPIARAILWREANRMKANRMKSESPDDKPSAPPGMVKKSEVGRARM